MGNPSVWFSGKELVQRSFVGSLQLCRRLRCLRMTAGQICQLFDIYIWIGFTGLEGFGWFGGIDKILGTHGRSTYSLPMRSIFSTPASVNQTVHRAVETVLAQHKSQRCQGLRKNCAQKFLKLRCGEPGVRVSEPCGWHWLNPSKKAGAGCGGWI
jgi:hypothetical protein